MPRIQLLCSMTTLSVRIELQFGFICRRPPNTANIVTVFEGSSIRYNTPR